MEAVPPERRSTDPLIVRAIMAERITQWLRLTPSQRAERRIAYKNKLRYGFADSYATPLKVQR